MTPITLTQNLIAPGIMSPNAHERAEWTRYADALKAADKPEQAARFYFAAKTYSLPIAQFDALQSLYRAWLVFGTL